MERKRIFLSILKIFVLDPRENEKTMDKEGRKKETTVRPFIGDLYMRKFLVHPFPRAFSLTVVI